VTEQNVSSRPQQSKSVSHLPPIFTQVWEEGTDEGASEMVTSSLIELGC
jgi:hypothetical protein